MNKRFFRVLLCGATVVLSTGTFTSCNNDDIDDLKSRVSVVEGAYAEIKDQLSKALLTGASIVDAKKDEATGIYTLTLSDGQIIKLGGGSAGGSDIKVVLTDNEAIITVGDVEYRLPLGSLVNSLIYSPETVDGIVTIGNEGAIVNFLARPVLTSLDGAKFSIAESHALTRAVDGEQFKVNGEAKLEGGFIKVPIKALGEVEAGKIYAVSLQLNLKGTIIGSNYFNMKVSDDFSAVAEDLGGVDIKTDYSPTDLADGFKEMTIKGSKLSQSFNFKDLFAELPDNAVFAVASQSKQPGGKAQEKYELLSNSLKPDGTWELAGRPETSFNESEERKGFLVNVLADDVVKAKIYVVINDELADVDFMGGLKGTGSQHMEYGEPTEDGSEGEGIIVNPGVNKLNLAKIFLEGQLSLKHGSTDNFLAAFKAYEVSLGDELLVYAEDNKLAVGDFAKSYCAKSRGLRWFNMQTSIASSNRRGQEMPEKEDDRIPIYGGKCNGEIIAGWDGLPGEDMAAKGLSVTEDGFFETAETYGGWALRIGMGIEFQYDYGTKKISDGVLSFLWINRRKCAEGVKDLDPR